MFSSPANVLPWQAANAVSFATFPSGRSGSLVREVYKVALASIFSVHRGFVWLQSNFNDKTYEKHFAYFRLQCFNDLPKNQLYLYSDADDICVRESIEQFQVRFNKNLIYFILGNSKTATSSEYKTNLLERIGALSAFSNI